MGIFDVEKVRDSFQTCVKIENMEKETSCEIDVLIKPYLTAFHEISRFFQNINIGFQIVSKSIDESCIILETLIESSKDPNDNAQTLPIITIQDALSKNVSRSFLNPMANDDILSSVVSLHRSLELILSILTALVELKDDNDSVGSVVTPCYTSTLARHHTWLVQKIAIMLINTLPNWGAFKNITVGDEMDETKCKVFMREIVHYGQIVYSRIGKSLAPAEFPLVAPTIDDDVVREHFNIFKT